MRIVASSNQSQRGPSWSEYSRQPREAAISSMPIRSKYRRSEKSGLSISIVTQTTAATAKPGTMLTRKSQCQENVSVKKPAEGRAQGRRQAQDYREHRDDARQLPAVEFCVDDRPHGRGQRAAAEPLHRPIDDHLVEAGGGGAQHAGAGEAQRGDDEQHAGDNRRDMNPDIGTMTTSAIRYAVCTQAISSVLADSPPWI